MTSFENKKKLVYDIFKQLKFAKKQKRGNLITKFLALQLSYEQYMRFMLICSITALNFNQFIKLSQENYKTFITHEQFREIEEIENKRIEELKPIKEKLSISSSEPIEVTDEDLENHDIFDEGDNIYMNLFLLDDEEKEEDVQLSEDAVQEEPLETIEMEAMEDDTPPIGSITNTPIFLKTEYTPEISVAQVPKTDSDEWKDHYDRSEIAPFSVEVETRSVPKIPYPNWALPRNTIIEEQLPQDFLYNIAMTYFKFYSVTIPIWMFVSVIIYVKTAKYVKYFIEHINCWKNTHRLEDFLTKNQISDTLNEIVQSMQNAKITISIANKQDIKTSIFTIFIQPFKQLFKLINNLINKQKNIPRKQNFIFVGPSGTGKTFLAEAIAGSSGVDLFYTTLGELQSSSISTGPKHLRLLLESAKIHAPSIILLENLELIGKTRGESTRRLDMQLFTELLVALTPPGLPTPQSIKQNSFKFKILKNLIQYSIQIIRKPFSTKHSKDKASVYPNILIGTTTDFDKLDPALIRPGRFDTVIHFSKPTYKDRLRLIYSFNQINNEIITPINLDQLIYGWHFNKLKQSFLTEPTDKIEFNENRMLVQHILYFAKKIDGLTHVDIKTLMEVSSLIQISEFLNQFNWLIISNKESASTFKVILRRCLKHNHLIFALLFSIRIFFSSQNFEKIEEPRKYKTLYKGYNFVLSYYSRKFNE